MPHNDTILCWEVLEDLQVDEKYLCETFEDPKVDAEYLRETFEDLQVDAKYLCEASEDPKQLKSICVRHSKTPK